MPNGDGLVEPQPYPAQRAKKAYPPLQWWPLRVMNPWHKFGVFVVYVVASNVVTRSAELLIPKTAVDNAWAVLGTALIVAIARSFRGWDEPVVAPRAWWRLTARPRAGWWLAAMYLLAAFVPVDRGWHPELLVEGVTSLLLGLAFLNSSIRLTILRRRP
ncbi:hypothetical protein ACFQ9V_03865 [Leifsonia sp. NPDC056665]|uniref:hypothetical protein n=1 Tax=Leifsonia sp. NPDC056665 TaxID=3345901 RepID=UPI0036C4B049